MDNERTNEQHAEAATVEEAEALRAALADREAELLARSESERHLLDRYREALLAGEPDIDPALVTGDSLDAIDTTFAAAKEMVDRLRGELTPGVQRVSPGAPGRRVTGPATAFEKIREGLARRAS